MVYAGIFFLSLATLILEISLTRILAIAQWYHFAFMVISIALFGFGASGSFLMLFPSILKKEIPKTLGLSSLCFSFTALFGYLLSNYLPFDPARVSWDALQPLYLLLYYVFLSMPFFFSGLTISILISRLAERVHRLYFSDLLGASLGSLLVLGIIFLFQAQGGVIVSAILGLVSSLLLGLGDKR